MGRQLQDELGAALTSVLHDMQQAVDQLAQALATERLALDSGNTEALDQVGTHKLALMLQMEQLDAERLQLSRELPALATAQEPAWARVVQSLRDCQQLNQRNGGTVTRRLHQVREALSILTGHGGKNDLYSRNGELHVSLRSRVLAEA